MIALVERFKLARKYRAAGCPSPWRWAGTAVRRDAALWVHHTTSTPLPPVRMPPPTPAKSPDHWDRFRLEHWHCRVCSYWNNRKNEGCVICHAPWPKDQQPPADAAYLEDEGSAERFAGAPRF